MRLIVITAPESVTGETETINHLFAEGLELLHIRKPAYSRSAITQLLEALRPEYRSRIALHSHHQLVNELGLGGCHYPGSLRKEAESGWGRRSTSCHTVEEIDQLAKEFRYLFVSPVFDSISKPGYRARFTAKILCDLTSRQPNLIALGGINQETLPRLYDQNWYGAAALGAIWEHTTIQERLKQFQLLRRLTANRNTDQ